MELLFYIFKLCAGIGLFLFAIYLLEESLKNLSGRNFKLFLQRITKNSVGAATGGAIVTAVLQSSSMVSLMVLAFVGAGVFTMKNAIAIILGANLGTTLDSWIVATLGFKMNIEVIAYPAVFVGGLLLIFFNNRKAIKHISFFLFGFGLLFIGLSFMKTAMEGQVQNVDFSNYAGMPLVIFLLLGFIITTIVQSSSVTMALTLSAIHAGAIDFAPAAAIILGSETGTTIKILIGSISGNVAKKRVALGNILFNIFITICAFALLNPILHLITNMLNIRDPLIGLVTFSSLINLSALVIFLPLLNPFVKFLNRFFKDTDASVTAFIGNANIRESETALDLFEKETAFFINESMIFNLGLFDIDTKLIQEREEFKQINTHRKFYTQSPEEKYEFLKQLQGEIHIFYLELRTKLQGEQSIQLNQLISSVRSCMHSVKSMKDVGSNIVNLSQSTKDVKFSFFLNHKKETEDLYRQLVSFLQEYEKEIYPVLQNTYYKIQNNYSTALNNFYKDARHAPIEDVDITTAINFNRELFTSNKAMLMAIKDLLLDEKQAEIFNEIPVYTT